MDPDGEDPSQKASRLAARAARFNKSAPGKRNKELEDARAKERQAFEAQGLINSGKTELGDAVDMKGTCETMCSPFEMETRNIRMEVHPFERGPDDKLDPAKAVAAYTRSDAGAGHGSSAILPSDLRTPATLVKTLDYLFSEIMPMPPKDTSSKSIDRKALGHSAGFIRDRTRAIRKEFAMQSTWGHEEAIASFERIARWHMLCLRELQEETGFNSDMHIDSAELGRCFTSLRHLYNDRREETGLEMPCPNEPEMRAYMLIFDLANKSVSIPTSELPAIILDDPLVKLAWEIRKSAQRNFDSQKEGSKLNAELGSNFITRFVRLLKQRNVPFLLSSLVEVRLRDMRRSALRAMTRTYPRLKTEPTRVNEAGEVVERKMVLLENLNKILGCEEQDDEETAWHDVIPSSRKVEDESVNVVSRFDLEVWPDKTQPVGSLINLGSAFNDNQDAPYTRRWESITEKRNGLSLVDIVNGRAGVLMSGISDTVPSRHAAVVAQPTPPPFSFTRSTPAPAPAPTPAPAFSLAPQRPGMSSTPSTSGSAFSFAIGKSSTPAAKLAPTPAMPKLEVPPATKQPSFFDKKVTFAPTPVASPPPSMSTPAPAEKPPVPTMPSSSFGEKPTTPVPDTAPAKSPSFFSAPTPAPAMPSPSFATNTVTPSPSANVPTASVPNTVHAIAPTVSPKRAQPSTAESEAQRRVRRKILPALCSLLIDEVVSTKLAAIQPDLESIAKRSRAAQAHALAKAKRQEEITKYAEQTYLLLLDQVIEESSREAYLSEKNLRRRLRRNLRGWRDWAARQREEREAAAKEREQAYDSLGKMGLAGSSFAWTSTEQDLAFSSASLGRSRSSAHGRSEQMDPFAADVMLHQTERAKDHFYSPSTFIDTIARHLAPLVQPSTLSRPKGFDASAYSQVFQTLISSSKKSATPSTDEAFNWLQSKFLPISSGFSQDGIAFEAHVLEEKDGFQPTNAGLLVLEAPLQTWSSEKQRINAAESRVRLDQLAQMADHVANEYTPGLMIITWEDETLDEVIERLGIEDGVSSFSHVAALSLETAEDLDTRFATALDSLFISSPVRKQVTVQLQDVANRLYPQWERMLSVLKLLSGQHCQDVSIICRAFKSGIDTINDLERTIQTSLNDVEICDTSTFDPLVLPEFAFDMKPKTTMAELAEGIAQYLQNEIFSEVSDVALFAAPTRQAAVHSFPLPIDGILQSLATLVFSDIATASLPLRAFFASQAKVDEFVSHYLQTTTSSYTESVTERIKSINASLPRSKSSPASKTSPKKSPITTSPKTLKRSRSKVSVSHHDENRSPRAKETKALKHAKLLQAMQDVERSLESMEMEEVFLVNGVF